MISYPIFLNNIFFLLSVQYNKSCILQWGQMCVHIFTDIKSLLKKTLNCLCLQSTNYFRGTLTAIFVKENHIRLKSINITSAERRRNNRTIGVVVHLLEEPYCWEECVCCPIFNLLYPVSASLCQEHKYVIYMIYSGGKCFVKKITQKQQIRGREST